MMRLAAGVEYDGTAYHGWQSQRHDPKTVQAVVEQALSAIAAEPIQVVCAGRTDAGVHASGQVVHFDTTAVRAPYNWVMGTNTQLPDDVSLAWVQPVEVGFHARFSATSRQYAYLIRRVPFRSALLRHATTATHRPLDPVRMAKAATALVGTHDFNAYRSVHCQAKTSVRTISRLGIHVHGHLLAVHVEADGFLQNMVRTIVGVLMAIGAGDAAVEWAGEVLASGDRTQGGVTAPPQGLYFLGPTYREQVSPEQTVRIPPVLASVLDTAPVEPK